ncbi:hypothetical protein [Psychrobacillus sp. FSL K6-1415]|uniref:hypothetical protein n=1 Tax=Psychrobacillus sp. FSL K6-1415 TaxID=2921544 RepID=UPI0030F6D4E6
MNKTSVFNRHDFINHLSTNMYEVLILKKSISDVRLRKHHLSSKGIGDDLYYLTESYYRQSGLYKGKHSMSDFISIKAINAIEEKKIIGNLKFEHMVPKNYYIKQLSEKTLDNSMSPDFVQEVLSKYYYVCTVTTEEDALLHATKMDVDWDGINPFLRYERAGIQYVENNEV